MHILNHQNQFGAIQDSMGQILTVQIGTDTNWWESYYIQTYHQKIC
jgi:hypothetical protein